MGSCVGLLHNAGRVLLDFAYPPYCVVCKADIEAVAILCAKCWLAIEKAKSEHENSMSDHLLCRSHIFKENIILGDFSGILQEAIYALKFHNQPRLGHELGRRMALWRAEHLASIDYLLPVPLHPARLRERGYNQSLQIASGLAAGLGVPICNGLLHRRKNTRQQALLSAEERGDNLRGAFSQVGQLPVGARVGLVDDVLTTGATLQACAQALQTDRLSSIVLAWAKGAS